MRRPPRRAARRTGRTTARRTTRRVMRRRRRRRIMVGGMVVLAASGTAAAIKMSQQDAQRVEQHAGAPVEELNEEELSAAMKDLIFKHNHWMRMIRPPWPKKKANQSMNHLTWKNSKSWQPCVIKALSLMKNLRPRKRSY